MKIKTFLLALIILAQPIINSSLSLAVNIENPVICWENVGELITPRRYAETVEYNGNIYIFGGRLENTIYDNAECYNIETGDVIELPNMPVPKYQFKIDVIGGKIYCFGGITKENGKFAYSDTVEIYNPQSNSWEINEDIKMTRKRGEFGSVRVGDEIYFISGGVDYINNLDNLVEAYNIKTNTWETKSKAPFSKSGFSTYYYDGKIYCDGGYSRSYERYIYDIKSDSWTTEYSPLADDYSRSAILKDYAFFIGGGGLSASGFKFADWIYDIKKEKWSPPLDLKPTDSNGFKFINLHPVVIENEAYYFGVEKKSDKTAKYIYKLSLEDNVAPNMEYMLNPTTYTNSHVDIEISANDTCNVKNFVDGSCGVKRIILPDGNSIFGESARYSVNLNGLYSFASEDINGNMSFISVKVTNIDKNKPRVEIVKSPDGDWSNQDVTVSIYGND